MSEKWSDELPDDAFMSESEKLYRSSMNKIKDGLAKGFDFQSAAATIDIADENLKQAVIDDILKVIIAEEHFVKQVDLEMLSRALNLSLERIEKAKTEMLEDIENSAVSAFYAENDKGTEH